jgi:hypothetical protein
MRRHAQDEHWAPPAAMIFADHFEHFATAVVGPFQTDHRVRHAALTRFIKIVLSY